MKRIFLTVAFLLLAFNFAAGIAGAQTLSGTTPVKWVSALPATCTTTRRDRVLVYKYTATSGVYYCSAANVWTLVGTNTVSYPLLASDGTAADPAYAWSSDTDTGMYRSGANTLNWSTGGTLRATLSSAGLFTTTGGLSSTTGAFTSPVTSTQGTITTSQPFINHTATWNNAGVVFENITSDVTDSASNGASTLLDLKVGGTSQFHVDKDGSISSLGNIAGVSGEFSGPITLTQGTITTNTPYINHTATVNEGSTTFTGILSNITDTNSTALKLIDLQVDGTTQFTVSQNGSTTVRGSLTSTGPTGGIGYAVGAGSAVTQATSRTTGVTLNRVTGAITLVSAAGSATPASFTVTNNTIAATDVVQCSQKSGTDKYIIAVTNVAAGSFQITSYTTGGTTTEQPVFNCVVIRGVAS